MHILRLSGDGGCMFCSPKVSDLSALRRHHSAPRARTLTSFLCMHDYSITSCNYAYIISLSASYSKGFLPYAGRSGRFLCGWEIRSLQRNGIAPEIPGCYNFMELDLQLSVRSLNYFCIQWSIIEMLLNASGRTGFDK